jgi:hypothetical protein
MRKVALLIGILAGVVVAFFACGGAALIGSIDAAMNAAPISATNLPQ